MPLAGVRWNGLDVIYQPDIVSVIVQRGQGFVTHRINTIRLNEVWPAYRPNGEYRIEWADDEEKVQHIEVKVHAANLPTNQDVIAYVLIDREDLEAAALTDRYSPKPRPPAEGPNCLRKSISSSPTPSKTSVSQARYPSYVSASFAYQPISRRKQHPDVASLQRQFRSIRSYMLLCHP